MNLGPYHPERTCVKCNYIVNKEPHVCRKPRSPIARIGKRKLEKLGGKIPLSTISKRSESPRKVNPVAKAKRTARYRKVLSSPRWKALRLKVWARMWKRVEWGMVRCCEKCGAELHELREMQLAHLTYARFGKELDTDVQGQCKQCNQTEAALRGKRIRRTA